MQCGCNGKEERKHSPEHKLRDEVHDGEALGRDAVRGGEHGRA